MAKPKGKILSALMWASLAILIFFAIALVFDLLQFSVWLGVVTITCATFFFGGFVWKVLRELEETKKELKEMSAKLKEIEYKVI